MTIKTLNSVQLSVNENVTFKFDQYGHTADAV